MPKHWAEQVGELMREGELLGALLIDLDTQPLPSAPVADAIVIGLDPHGRTPPGVEDACDLLLTTAAMPPAAWVSEPADSFAAAADHVRASAERHPLAASILAQVLRLNTQLSFAEALQVESLAYSTLLAGREFLAWRTANPPRPVISDTRPRVHLARDDGTVTLTLARPERLNAFDAAMRDDLVEALRAVADDPSVERLHVMAEGKAFSSGGDLDTFGTTPDVATAHAIRTLRAPALLLHGLRARTTAYLHGACIGAGIECAAAAGRVVAAPDSWFQLPEISLGLIPGAGGTVTVPRRIGRHRTLYWALTGKRLDVDAALAWGLIDAVGEPS